MINSRDLDMLLDPVRLMAEAFVAACADAGIEVVITSTYRDNESQNALYAQGRTAPGKKVTNAKGGQSWHNWHVAFDFVPIIDGKPDWNNLVLFDQCGEIGESVGLEWGGRWDFVDRPHLQFTNGLTLKDFQNGATL